MNDFTFAACPRLLALCMIAGAASAARGQGNFVCDHLGPRLLDLDVIAERIDARLAPSEIDGEPWGGSLDLRSCTRRSRFQGTYVSSFQSGGPVAHVATAASGVAVRFRKITPGTQYRSFVDGDLVTGGGKVVGDFTPDDIDGTIDTSGTHPLVAECEQAIADARAASEYFAGLPATRSFGATTVQPFTSFEIDAAPDDVIHFDALAIHGDWDPEFPGLCYDQTYVDISGGPAVINIDRLDIGNCVAMYSDATIVLNIPGRGPQVRIGRGSVVTLPILAPERIISAVGTLDDQATHLGSLWGRQVKLMGLVYPEWDFEGCD